MTGSDAAELVLAVWVLVSLIIVFVMMSIYVLAIL